MQFNIGLSEKEVLSWFRSSIRQGWANSPMKRKLEEESKILVENSNPKSSKRFPKVWKRKCMICNKEFSIADTELDHITGENKLTSYSDASNFIKSIWFPKKSETQWLCIDKYKIVNKKKVLDSFGCHGIKTLAERQNISFQEAGINKIAIKIIKDKQDKQFFIDRNLDIPSNTDKRRKQIVEILLNDMLINNDRT